ncbi:hypothetical protein D3C86_1942440 [compost metagenome]
MRSQASRRFVTKVVKVQVDQASRNAGSLEIAIQLAGLVIALDDLFGRTRKALKDAYSLEIQAH